MSIASDDLEQNAPKRRPARRDKLTKSKVEAIPVPLDPSKRNYLWDTEVTGFGVMVTHTGSRSYLIQYTIGGRSGKPQRFSIGRHGNPWTLDKARALARDKMMMVRCGLDPNQDRKKRLEDEEHRRQLNEELNFEKLANEFLKAKSQLKRSKQDRSLFDRILIPRFGKGSVADVLKDDVHKMNDEIGDKSESAANTAFGRLKAFLNWASDKKERHFPYTPISKMKLPYKEGKRTRFFSEAEVRYLWLASETLPAPIEAWLKMLILTGLRLQEVARAHWREINLDAREWIIPAERMKNNKPHMVPLTRKMIAILKSVGPTAAQRRGYVFSLNGTGPINSFSKTKDLIETALSRIVGNEFRKNGFPLPAPATIADWVYHDTRRTVTTHLVKNGISITITEAILSHALPGVSQVSEHYIVYNFAKEKREALELWTEMVERVVVDTSLFEVPTVPFDGEPEQDLEGLLAMELDENPRPRALINLSKDHADA